MLCFFVSPAQKNAMHIFLPQDFNNLNTTSQLDVFPDVAVNQTNISLHCGETVSELIINYCNLGDATLTAPYYITIFNNDIGGEILKIDTVNQPLSQNDCIERTIFLNTSTICNTPNLDYLTIVVNSTGNGIAQNGGLQEESNTDNNVAVFSITHNSAQITGNHYICQNSEALLTCTQADAYLWNTNETTQSISVSEPAQYSVTAYYSEGCPAISNNFSTAFSESPILDVFLNDIVAGTTDTAVIGYIPTDNLVLASNIAQSQFNKVVFIPDGVPCDTLGCKYVATFSFAGYPEDAVINSIDDILYLRLNIEHSFIGDLFINFICPNEQNAYILKKGGASNSECSDTIPSDGFGWHSGSNICTSANNCRPYLGNSNSSKSPDSDCDPTAPGNAPGIGWNYCWSNNNNHNYQYNDYIYRANNFQSYELPNYPWTIYKIADSSDVSQGTNFYIPDQSFENLVGCPINGTWKVEVIDGLRNDNGYIFSCEVAIDENILSNQAPTVTSYSMEGLWLTQINDSTYTINPPANQKDTIVTYHFTVVGDDGCTYEATYDVNVYGTKLTDLYDTIKSSQLPYTWNDSTFCYAGNKTTVLQTYYGTDSIVTMHLSVVYQHDTTICENEFPYTWHGITFNSADIVEVSQTVDVGSYNIFNLVLNTYPTNNLSFAKTISSDSVPYMWHGQLFNDSETKSLKLKNIYGCDSIVTLILTVNHDVYVSVDSFVCAHDFPFTWNGKTFYEPDTDVANLTTATGADSVITMNVFAHPLPDATILGDTVFCSDEDITIYANEAKSYLWSTGDTSQTITISNSGLYSLTVTDVNNCTNTSSRQINKFSISPIAKINKVDVCAGSSVPVIVGYDSITSTFVIAKGETTLSLSETIFLPDGQYCGCSYRSPLTFTAFNDNETVQSVNDILYVKLNMEHSYAGDLYINITCPNNQKANILKLGTDYYVSSYCASNIPNSAKNWHNGQNLGYNTYFGLPIDYDYTSSSCNPSASGNEPGTGWNYCWSNNTTEGYQYGAGNGNYIYRQGNGVSCTFWGGWYYGYYSHNVFDSSDVANGTQFYHPDQSFQSLVGCPLNGSWYIEVIDGLEQDNGYIFGWELALAPHLYQSEYNDITHVTADGPWISNTSDTTFIIQPPDTIRKDTIVKYTFHFYDDFGCAYDTVLFVNVFAADSSVQTVSSCDSYTWQNQTYTQSGVYTKRLQTTHGCDSTLVLDLTISNSVVSSDSIFLVENQLPYYYSPANTTIPVGSPAISQINYTLPSSNNCDSTITLKVVIEYNSSQSFDTTICHYDFPLLWHGKTFQHKGIYYDSIINNNGTTTYITYSIHVDSMSIVSSMVTHVTCFGDSTGAATINVVNGQNPLSYKWSDSNNVLISTTSHLQNVPVGTYIFVVSDDLGCSAADSVTINNINPLITQGIIADNREVCIGQNIDIFKCNAANVSGIYQWQISSNGTVWNSAPGINNDTNYIYPNPVTDSFKLRRVFSHPDCGTYITDTVAITILPVILNTIYDSVCQYQTYELNGFNISADYTSSIDTLTFSKTYSTQNCDSIVTLKLKVKAPLFTTIFDSVCQNQPYMFNDFDVPADSTAIIDTLTFSKTYSTQNCDSTVTLKLIVVAPKHNTISDFVCQSQSYQLNGFDIPADSTAIIDILTFSKTFSTQNCDSIVTLKLTVVAPTENTVEDFVCKGNAYHSYGFNINADSLLDKTSYEKTLLLQNSYGCDSLVNLKLNVIDTFLKLTNLTTDFCETYSAELHVETRMEHILWSTNEQTPSIIVTRPATYFVTASEKNCINSKSITIESCPWNMYLPNAINPNGCVDENKFFALSESSKQDIDALEITIYNRWGNTVFHSCDKNFIWEGTIDGQIMHNNVYTYIIYCTKNNGKKLIFKGNITVL